MPASQSRWRFQGLSQAVARPHEFSDAQRRGSLQLLCVCAEKVVALARRLGLSSCLRTQRTPIGMSLALIGPAPLYMGGEKWQRSGDGTARGVGSNHKRQGRA